MSVELIYDHDCPNVAPARANLLRAFAETGVVAKWTEWERSSPETPAHAHHFGSPAILVNGKDIADLPPNAASCCRIYSSADGKPSGVPSVELISRALRVEAGQADVIVASGKMKQHLVLLPAILLALLPKVACPACWPAYAGLLSAVGVGFLARAEYLLPLTAIFLGIVLIGLAFRARARRGYGLFFWGVLGAAAVLVGKFVLELSFLFYAGLSLLVGASLWNTWPRKESKIASCCECAPAGERSVQ